MGFRDWFKQKSSPRTDPRVIGTSPGGSPLIAYGGDEFSKPTFGFTEESTHHLVEIRERAYEKLFGPGDSVFHEMLPLVPHVDVHTFKPGYRGRSFFTLVTSGMSDLPMAAPPEAGPSHRRAELVLYTDTGDKQCLELLRRLAHFPHNNKTWLNWGHTMLNGTPPEPVFQGHAVDAFFFAPSIVHPDADLTIKLEGEPLRLLWVIPVTAAECELKLQRGSDALFNLFDEVHHPLVFSLAHPRASYV